MSRQQGFTLLEMLAALALLAVCASVLLVAFGQGARSLQQLASNDRISLAARSLFDQLDAGPLQAGHSQGQWDGLPWSCDIAPIPAQGGQARLWQIELSVRDGARQAQFSTLRVRSGGSGP